MIKYYQQRDRGISKWAKGKNSFFARTISVAVSYDAMISKRPYNHEIEKEKAVHELKRNVLTQFDPVIVEAFAKVIWKYNNITLQRGI